MFEMRGEDGEYDSFNALRFDAGCCPVRAEI